MASNKSNVKGGAFEREIGRRLSLWLSDGENAGLLYRSSMSGGRATLSLDKDENLSSQAGDLTAIHSMGFEFIETFFIELKRYKDLQAYGLVYNTGGNLMSFIQETDKQAKKHGKEPLLIVKQDFKPCIMLMRPKSRKKFEGAPTAHASWQGFGIYDFENFLSQAKFIRGGS